MPKQPQDHLPAKAEAKSGPVHVPFDGVDYQIDRENINNLELFEFIEDEQYIKAIRGFLGLDQWAKFKDSQRDDQDRVSAAKFEDFLNAVMEAVGGKSASSGGSSASTPSN